MGPALLHSRHALHHYRFRSSWELTAPFPRVFPVLADPLRYPLWWPQILEVRQLTDDSGRMRFRSLLPYELNVTAFAVRNDPESGVLEARLVGDLEGVTRWAVSSRGDGGTVAVFHEDVVVTKPLMRLLALPGRPAFRANHAWMMRRGRLGLARHLGLCHWS